MISFVIPVRNDAARLARCLASIRASRCAPDAIEIVVADNGSTDDSAAAARAHGATVLELPGLRLGELRNRAVAASKGDILAFVDADHEIVPEWVPSALDVLVDPRVVGVGAPCFPPSPATWVQRSYDRLRRHPSGRTVVEWLGSGNLVVRRAAFDAVGGFDTSLETCEDVDLCRKLRASGGILIGDSRLRNIHYGDPQTLRHVFFGEMWRGRDNIRVSLRAPRTMRTMVSAAIPAFTLLALLATGVGLLIAGAWGFGLAALAVSSLIALVGLRAFVMLRGLSPRETPPAVAVAAAYEFGRAMALATRLGYGRRRREAVA